MFDLHSIWEIEAVNTSMKLGSYFKMNAKTQREIFGYVPFGRNDIKLNIKTGEVSVSWKIAFGQDCEVISFTGKEIAEFLNNGRRIKEFKS